MNKKDKALRLYLLRCDVRTPEGIELAVDNHLFTEFCPKMVESAVDILEMIMREDLQGNS